MEVKMNFIVWALLGAIMGALAGWNASTVKGRNTRMSTGVFILLGVVGAELGGSIAFGLAQGVLGYYLTWAIGGALLLIIPAYIVAVRSPRQEIQSSESPKIQQEIEKQRLPNTQAKKVEKQNPSKPSPKKTPSGIIFLSYRRADSTDIAGRIYDRLLGAFDRVAVFKDVDSIPLGTDFKEYLDEKVSECNVLLAVIGDKWLETSDAKGKRRLEDPQDFVRIEIESALARNIPVIPLLVRGASMPSEEELPAGLKKLAFRNGTQIRSDPDFHRDMDRVIAALKGYVESKR
jgi:uncharacterized membrane protein YeaQ/YmgE (transglycosylase-associated protein family)